MMRKSSTPDQRTTPRFNLQKSIRLHGSTLPLAVKPTGASRLIEGHIQNVSSGGLCLLAPKPLKISELLVAEIAVPGTKASIPTLLQVRWLQKSSLEPPYRVGLDFVLKGGMAQALQTSTKIAGFTVTGEGVRKNRTKK